MHSDSSTRRRLTLVAMSLGFAVVQLDVSVVNVAVRSIGAELGGGVADLQWVVNAYTVAFAAFILNAGALADRFGARRLCAGGFAVFGVASVACAIAPSLAVLIAARAVQGVGAAVLVPASLTLLGHAYTEPAARARAVGLWLAGASIAFAAGPLVGGGLIAAFDWRAVFVINVPLVLIGFGLTLTVSAETPRATDRRFDLVGQPLAVLGLGVLVAATIEGGLRGFGSTPVLGGFALAVAALVAFVAVERHRDQPMLPLSLFTARAFSVPAAIGLFINCAVYGLLFVFSLFFQVQQGHSPLAAGLLLLPEVGGLTVANLVAARVAHAIGPVRVLAAGALLFAVGAACLAPVAVDTPYPVIAVALALLGLGSGTIVPVITAELLGSVERDRSGIAAGTLNTLRQTGSALGVALFGALVSGGFIAGLRLSAIIAAVLAVVIAAATPLMRTRRPVASRAVT